MRKLIYHVATTLDGFIAHPDGSTTGFLEKGEHVSDYLHSLHDYDAVVMGRKTYEFGYNYGLKAGQPAYPHMMHYICSKSLSFNQQHKQVKIVREGVVDFVRDLKQTIGSPIIGSPIYLCGGGEFAGLMLRHRLIDELKIKLNPVYFGEGISLFGDCPVNHRLEPLNHLAYESGVHLLHYELNYNQ